MKKEAKEKIKTLVEKYEQVRQAGKLKSYTEEETKKDFILPLFKVLGWEVDNKNDVSAEESIISSGRVDYGFYLNDRVKFYVETKKLSVDLHKEEFANQAIRYSWNRGATWAVLIDFESLKVFNAQDIEKSLADKKFFEIPYTEYLKRFDQLWLLSKEAFKDDLLDKEAEKYGKKLQKISVTSLLYKDLQKCRDILTKHLGQWNPKVDKDLLDEGVQKLLDRLIFIRVAEDRGIEPPILKPMVREARANAPKKHLYQSMIEKFREFDDIYNSNLFLPHSFEQWQEYSGATERVIDILYGKKGYYEYDFKVMPADVLGSVYENYLGYRLSQAKKKITIARDAKKRKEHGIYYTPNFIVDYIVKSTLGPVLDKCKTIHDLKKIKVLDPACGSGSFLVKALEMINDKYKKFGAKGNTFTKLQILTENIYGVDLDEQAVEIARLNLLINALDERIKLPLLTHNIKNGNSLISGTDKELKKYFGKNFRDKKPFNWQEEFPEVFKQGGFDVVIGNPPYLSFYSKQSQKLSSNEMQYYCSSYSILSGASGTPRLNTIMLFFEKGIQLLKKDGMLGFIFDQELLDVAAYQKIRKYILFNCNIQEIIHEVCFPEINIDTSLIFLRKNENNANNNITWLKSLDDQSSYKVPQSVFRAYDNNEFKYSSQHSFLDRIREKTTPLGRISTVRTGMCITIDDFCSDEKKNNQWHPAVFGSNVDRYSIVWPHGEQIKHLRRRKKYICFSKELEKKVNDKFAKKGSATVKIIGNENRFKQPRIFVRQGPSEARIIASYTKDDYYASQTLHVINQKTLSLKFILGLLNSKLISYYAKEQKLILFGGKKRPQIRTKDLAKIPVHIPQGTDEKKIQGQIVGHVDKMLMLNKEIKKTQKNSNKWNSIKSEIGKIDKKIDEEIYKLYGLTPEEIKIVGGRKLIKK